ncbi:MAG: SDR family oxidoreductase [Bdellovibrionaceae bacterium]|nr:SDR family oxidoreductase [Pseudobdellovibrionaceae bacterium]
MDLGIKNKKALVFGASSGLGKAVAQALVHEGARVAIGARSEGKLLAAKEQIGAHVCATVDMSQVGSAKTFTLHAMEQLGGADIVVINTGGPPKGAFSAVTTEQWVDGFQSLWMSTVDVINTVLPTMKQHKWGRILLITSAAAKEPIPELTISNGLRAGLLGLARSLSHEIAPYGITINSLLPGHTDTERLTNLGIDKTKIIEHIPAGRLGTTREFGALGAFLASDLAGFITGQAIVADGGAQHGI